MGQHHFDAIVHIRFHLDADALTEQGLVGADPGDLLVEEIYSIGCPPETCVVDTVSITSIVREVR